MPSTSSHTAPWCKRILIPLWTFQLAFMLLLLGISINADVSTNLTSNPITAGMTFLILNIICIILTFVEIALFAFYALPTRTYLMTQIFKTAFWIVLLAVDCAGLGWATADPRYGPKNAMWVLELGILQIAVVLCALITALGYAVSMHRRRRRLARKSKQSIQGAVESGPSSNAREGTWSVRPYAPSEKGETRVERSRHETDGVEIEGKNHELAHTNIYELQSTSRKGS